MKMSVYGYEAEELIDELMADHRNLVMKILKQSDYPEASYFIGRSQARLHMAEEVKRLLNEVSPEFVLRYYEKHNLKEHYDRLSNNPPKRYIAPVTLQKLAESLRDSCYSDSATGSRTPFPGSKENLGYMKEMGIIIEQFSVRPKKLS